jgi:phage gp46-like protein
MPTQSLSLISPSSAPDPRLVQNVIFPKYSVTLDLSLLNDGTLDETQALATAVCIALGTNSLADEDDPLPDPDSTDRQGWWGDLDAEEIWGAWPIGSKLWLMKREKIEGPNAQRGATVARVKSYIVQALQPFIDNRICSRVTVDVTRSSQMDDRIDSLVTIYRGPLPAIELRYQILWNEQSQIYEPRTEL